MNQAKNKLNIGIAAGSSGPENELRNRVTQAVIESERAHKKENYAFVSHRGTIALWKAWICFKSPRPDGKKSVVRYSLEPLDSEPGKSYIALENSIRRTAETEPLFSHAFVYLRRDDIADGTLIGTYTDTEAFTDEFFQYHRNPERHMAYLRRVRNRIELMQQIGGYEDRANFLQEVLNRAINFF